MKAKHTRRPVAQLRHFLKTNSSDSIAAAASQAGTSTVYLSQLAGGHRQASCELAKALELAIPGLLRAHLRPDVFADLQPEAAAEAISEQKTRASLAGST